MKKIQQLLCLLIAFQLSISLLSAQCNYTNPMVKGNFPDPWVVKDSDGWYYWCKQDYGKQITVERSRNIPGAGPTQDWTKVFATPTGGVQADVWAPELHKLDGKWYIYASGDMNGAPGLQDLRIFVLEAANPLGPYTFKGLINIPGWCIDPNVVVLPNGKKYISWSHFEGGGQTIRMAPLNNPWTIGSPNVLLSAPYFDWERRAGNVNEGPEFLIKNNKLHIAYSASQCHTRWYCLGLLTTDINGDVLNPSNWQKSPVPVFQEGNGAYGPGHNTFVKSPNGQEDWIIYHAHREPWQDAGEHNDRDMHAQSFSWNGDYPQFGAPVGVGISRPCPATGSGIVSGQVYRLVSRQSGQALDVSACAKTNGANVQQWPWLGGNCQRWKVEATDNGYYRLISQNSGQALDVAGCSTTNGANVQQWPWNGAACQQWKIEATSNGYYRLLARHSNQALDVAGCSTTNGANVQQWPWNGAACQQWKLELVSPYAREGVEEVAQEKTDLEVFPNPAANILRIRHHFTQTTAVNIQLLDMLAKPVASRQETAPAGLYDTELDTHATAPGIYLLRVQMDNKSVFRKVVIQK